MPDHGVQRIDRLVGQRQRRPAQHQKAERGYDTVCGALRDGLHRRPHHLRLGQLRGVTPDHAGDGVARLVETSGLQRTTDRSRVVGEVPRRQRREREQDLDGLADHVMEPA